MGVATNPCGAGEQPRGLRRVGGQVFAPGDLRRNLGPGLNPGRQFCRVRLMPKSGTGAVFQGKTAGKPRGMAVYKFGAARFGSTYSDLRIWAHP